MSEDARSDAASVGESDDSTLTIGRRQLLRTGTNVGVGAVAVFGFGRDYVTPGDLGTITYAIARSEPVSEFVKPRTREVPVAWHESIRVAFEIQEKIQSTGLSPLVESFVVPGSYDEPEASISVGTTDEDVIDNLENLGGDVPIDASIVDEIEPRPDEEYELSDPYQIEELDPEHVPGGVACETDDSIGTLAPAVFDVESHERLFATSNHVYGGFGTKETEHRGEPLSLVYEDEPYHIGDVKRGYPAADLVVVDPVEEYRPASEIERASPSRIVGQYTKAGLADLAARGEPLTKLGAVSGRTSGEIKGIDGVTCYTGEACKFGQLKWGSASALTDGDSGSVNFHVDEENPDDYVLVGGINNARTWWPGVDFTWGTAGHYLLEEYGLRF